MLNHRLFTRGLEARTWIRRTLATLLLVPLWGLPAAAQGYEAMQPMATRAELTALADRLARGSESDRNKASALRIRLRDGDFRPGDRIRLVIEGSVTQDDTISVKLNGHQTVDKLEVNGPTPHGFKGPEAADGPIWFEAFGRRVLYRNIWLVEQP